MKSLKNWIIEFIGTTVAIFALLLLLIDPLPGEAERPPHPLSQQEVLMFFHQCDGRVVLVRNQLECCGVH